MPFLSHAHCTCPPHARDAGLPAHLGIPQMARRLQNCLALAQFKTKHGWEDLTLDSIEPRGEEELRRKRAAAAARASADGDALSDSSSSISDLPYPSRALMSSPLRASAFSDALGSSSGASTGHRKRTYHMHLEPQSAMSATFLDAHRDSILGSSTKRFRPSGHRGSSPSRPFSQQQSLQRHHHHNHHQTPAPNASFVPPSGTGGSSSWKHQYQLAQSSPIKPRRQPHFTTSAGPDLSFFPGASAHVTDDLTSPPTRAATSDEEDDLLPAYSFRPSSSSHMALQSSPPTTPPPPPSRQISDIRGSGHGGLDRDDKENLRPRADGLAESGLMLSASDIRTGEEGADLLLYLAASPSPANPKKQQQQPQHHHDARAIHSRTSDEADSAVDRSTTTSLMEPPSTPPPRGSKLALPSSMMTTPGGGNPFFSTPGLAFDFADFVHMTPSPAQKPWKTPVAKTSLSAAPRRLTFEDM